MADRAGVLEAAHVEREQLGLGDFADHPDQLFLDELMAGDGLIVKLFPGLGVLQSGVVAGHGRADRSPADAVARLVEAHQRALEAAAPGSRLAAGTWTSWSERPLVIEARSDHLPWTSNAREAGAVGLDQEAPHAVVFIFDLGPDHGDVGDVAGGDPHLFAVENVLVAGFAGGGGHAAGIGAEAGLGQAEAAQLLAAGERREPGVLLLVGAEGVDGIHHERGLHADEAAEAGVAAFQFLHHQAVFDVGHAGAAVALEVGAEEAELAHQGTSSRGKRSVRKHSSMMGIEVVFDEIARGAADEQLVFGEGGIEMKKVKALKFEAHSTPSVSGEGSKQKG